MTKVHYTATALALLAVVGVAAACRESSGASLVPPSGARQVSHGRVFLGRGGVETSYGLYVAPSTYEFVLDATRQNLESVGWDTSAYQEGDSQVVFATTGKPGCLHYMNYFAEGDAALADAKAAIAERDSVASTVRQGDYPTVVLLLRSPCP